MAFYADKQGVKFSDKPDQYFVKRKPSSAPPSPGIYKCNGCGYEDVINRECEELPPCSNCREKITWCLLVKATDK
jgi:hypothetical protein